MEFTVDQSYDHTADAVFTALTDFAAVTAKYEAAGQREVTLVRRDVDDDGSITLVSTRVVPLDVPGFAKKFLSPTQTVTQTDEWGPPEAGRLTARLLRGRGQGRAGVGERDAAPLPDRRVVVPEPDRGDHRVQGAAGRRQDRRLRLQGHPQAPSTTSRPGSATTSPTPDPTNPPPNPRSCRAFLSPATGKRDKTELRGCHRPPGSGASASTLGA